jgi:predicted nuclease with TOPRIM domain
MKTFKEYIKEHPNLRARIIAKINPMDALRDKMDDLKKLPGKIKDKAVDKLKDTMDKVNPMSPINKMKTLADKEKIKKLQKDKSKLTTKAKGIGTKIKSLRAKTAK